MPKAYGSSWARDQTCAKAATQTAAVKMPVLHLLCHKRTPRMHLKKKKKQAIKWANFLWPNNLQPIHDFSTEAVPMGSVSEVGALNYLMLGISGRDIQLKFCSVLASSTLNTCGWVNRDERQIRDYVVSKLSRLPSPFWLLKCVRHQTVILIISFHPHNCYLYFIAEETEAQRS